MVCACVSIAEKSGAQFDPRKLLMRRGTYRRQVFDEHPSLMAIAANPGHTPVEMTRGSGTVPLPDPDGRVCRNYDFLLNLFSETPAEDGFALAAEEAVFYCELVVP